MTELNMDVDSVRAVMELILNKKDELMQLIDAIPDDVSVLEQGDWIGDPPTEFYARCREVFPKVKEKVEFMDTLAGQLRQAIADWEAAAAKLS